MCRLGVNCKLLCVNKYNKAISHGSFMEIKHQKNYLAWCKKQGITPSNDLEAMYSYFINRVESQKNRINKLEKEIVSLKQELEYEKTSTYHYWATH